MKQEFNHTTPPDFRLLFESAPGLYLVLSPSLKIVAVSDAYLQATMTRREDIIGHTIFTVFPDNPDDPSATGVGNLGASLKRVVEDKQPDAMAVQKYDIQRPKSEGRGFETRYWSPLNVPVFDTGGNLEYIIHRVEDVTEFIRLRQKRTEQDQLAADLKSRTEQMENEIYLRAQQLQQANEKLRESEKLKDQFLTNMSHEIRTPMNAIIGFAGLLMKTNLDVKQLEFLTAIKESGENLMAIINDILDFSKIQAGKIELENIAFSLRSLVDSVHRLLANKAELTNIDLIVYFDDHIPELLSGDPTRITQTLVNLLNNAIKFTEKGYVKLDVNLIEKKDNYCMIEFRIEDSGIGIAPEQLNTIFERFVQAAADTNRKYGGTGLGLSIVKNLVELQAGTIEVKSSLGKGSVFTVTIPLKQVSHEQFVEYKASNIIDQVKKLTGTRVLLVEDNLMNQRLAAEVLSGFGVITDLAENGRIAVEKLKTHTYDVILMDIQMEEMDGYQSSAHIREKLRIQTPIIAMTAHAIAGEREKCLAAGMNDYISKPFKTTELYKKIKQLLPVKATVEDEQQYQKETRSGGLIDLSYLKGIINGNISFLYEMIDLFISETPADLNRISKAIDAEDHKTIAQLAHKLRNSSGLMGIEELSDNLEMIESKCEQKTSIKEISRIFTKTREIYKQAIMELKKERLSI